YPETGCGVHNPDGTFDYWSYWRGGTGWTYSGVGADRNVADGEVDGWRFVHGMGEDPKYAPRPSPAGSCPPPTTTTTNPPSTTTTVGPGGGGGGSGPGGGGGGSRPPFHVTPTIKAGTSGQTTIEPGSTGDTIRGEALTEADSATTLDGEGFATPDGTNPDGSRNELATGDPAATGGGSSSGTGVPIAVAGGGVIIVALGVTAALRFRAKPED
ncbi:MAG TPA: hypothetical protein VIJ47_06980, partial [Acidimicrobiales bacterium]